MHSRLRTYVVAGIFAAVGVLTVVGPSLAQAADQRDCDDNAIMRCGAYSLSELREKYMADVPTVFAHYGVSSGEVKGTSGTVQSGYVTKSGNVVVGDKVVATGAVTVGRQNMSGSTAVTIGGKTYYERTPSVSFQTDKLDAYVFFDRNGVFSGAVIKSCGNPVDGEPEAKPTAVCKGITKNTIARNKFSFDGAAEVKDGAKVTGYVFTIKDSAGATVASKTVSTSDLKANSGEITLDKAGTYTARVTVKTSVGDKTGNSCETSFTVAEPDKPSIMIYKTVDDVERKLVAVNETFTYKISVKNTGKVDLTRVLVTDKQPTSVQFIKPSAGAIKDGVWSVTIDLKAGETKNFTITAKVTEYKSGDITNTACVNAPAVNPDRPNDVDGCDKAVIYVKEPVVNKIIVCELATKKIIKINESDFDSKKHSKDLDRCRVLGDNTMWVCVLETKEIIEIKQSDFDSKKHSKNLNDCRETIVMVQVCDPATGDIIKVKESEAGNYKPVNDPACDEQKPTSTIPSTGPETTVLSGLVGSSALGLGVTSYMRSRHALRSALRK